MFQTNLYIFFSFLNGIIWSIVLTRATPHRLFIFWSDEIYSLKTTFYLRRKFNLFRWFVFFFFSFFIFGFEFVVWNGSFKIISTFCFPIFLCVCVCLCVLRTFVLIWVQWYFSSIFPMSFRPFCGQNFWEVSFFRFKTHTQTFRLHANWIQFYTMKINWFKSIDCGDVTLLWKFFFFLF